NHLHVILCLHRDNAITVRNLASLIGITERSVQRILSELEEAKAISRKREGRCNTYKIRYTYRLRHSLEKNHTIGELLTLLEE
ncbi:MAG: helix-turn-helix domain-containing protein, partial [Akkermansiaceae bacterium]